MTLFVTVVVGLESCNKIEDSNVIPPTNYPTQNTETLGAGLEIKYTGYSMNLPNSSTATGGNPIYEVPYGVMTLAFDLAAPAGFKRIEATKYEYGETTSFKNFQDNAIVATDTTISLGFTLSNSQTEVKVTIVDKNCKTTSYTVKLHPFNISSVYSGKKIYSQHSGSSNPSFYSATKYGSYLAGGSIPTMDINLAYKVGASPNYTPYLYSPEEEFGGLMISNEQAVPTSGSPQTNYIPTTKSLADLSIIDLYQAIGASSTCVKIEAGKTYFFRSYTSPVTTYGAIKINSISGINNDVLDFDYVVLYSGVY